MAWDSILKNEEFQSQPYETKFKVANNYFDKKIATESFKKQPKELQEKVKLNFLNTIGAPKPEKSLGEFTPPTWQAPPDASGNFPNYGLGNIDLNSRPVVSLPEGKVATLLSFSFKDDDGKEVLLPTITEDGNVISKDLAIKEYKKTGKYLGKFDTPDEATKYAKQLSQSQSAYAKDKLRAEHNQNFIKKMVSEFGVMGSQVAVNMGKIGESLAVSLTPEEQEEYARFYTQQKMWQDISSEQSKEFNLTERIVTKFPAAMTVGVYEFMLGVPYYTALGYGEGKKEGKKGWDLYSGSLRAGARRWIDGKVLHILGQLKKVPSVAGQAAFMEGQQLIQEPTIREEYKKSLQQQGISPDSPEYKKAMEAFEEEIVNGRIEALATGVGMALTTTAGGKIPKEVAQGVWYDINQTKKWISSKARSQDSLERQRLFSDTSDEQVFKIGVKAKIDEVKSRHKPAEPVEDFTIIDKDTGQRRKMFDTEVAKYFIDQINASDSSPEEKAVRIKPWKSVLDHADRMKEAGEEYQKAVQEMGKPSTAVPKAMIDVEPLKEHPEQVEAEKLSLKAYSERPTRMTDKLSYEEWKAQQRPAITPAEKGAVKEEKPQAKPAEVPTAKEPTDPYSYQDGHAESVVARESWDYANSFRHILEGSGDIFRELAKYKEGFYAKGYIDEKLSRVNRFLDKVESGTIHPDDSIGRAREKHPDKLALTKKEWEGQPVETYWQDLAKKLNLALVDGDFKTARDISNKLQEVIDKDTDIRRPVGEVKKPTEPIKTEELRKEVGERTAQDAIDEIVAKEKLTPEQRLAKKKEEEAPTIKPKFIEPKFGEVKPPVERPLEELQTEMDKIVAQMTKVRATIKSETDFSETTNRAYEKLDELDDQYRLLRKAAERKPGYVERLFKSERGAIGDLSPVETFYSQLERVVEAKIPGKTEAYIVKRILENPQTGIKKGELEDTGVLEWLAGKRADEKVTKKEVLDYVKQNTVKVEVKELGGARNLEVRPVGIELPSGNKAEYYAVFEGEDQVSANYSTKDFAVEAMKDGRNLTRISQPQFDRDTLKTPGGTNYREHLYKVPLKVKIEPASDLERRLYKAVTEMQSFEDQRNDGRISSKEYWKLLDDTLLRHDISLNEYNEYAMKTIDSSNRFVESHFNEPDVIAHSRVQDVVDTSGKKGQHLTEVQSLLHQTGRMEGYVSEVSKVGVPNYPFKKNWFEFVIKKELREAVETGKDFLSWTTGEEQNKRYSLSTHVKDLHVTLQSTGYDLYSTDKEGTGHTIASGLRKDELPAYIGKELSEKILKDLPNNQVIRLKILNDMSKEIYNVPYSQLESQQRLFVNSKAKGILPPDVKSKIYAGLDLEVGGSGMKGFYDKILVDFVNNYAKKWGVRVEKRKLEGGAEAWALPINSVMKQDVLYKGQPLYFPGSGAIAQLKPLKEQIFDPAKSFWSKLPNTDDLQRMIGNFDGSTQVYEKVLADFGVAFKKDHPDMLVRRAMSRYLESGMDEAQVKKWMDATNDADLKKVYKKALELTPEEKETVGVAKQMFDDGWEEARKAGLLSNDAFVNDYFIHMGIEKPDSVESIKRFMNIASTGVMETRPNFAKKRFFDTLFDLEQSGYKQRYGADDLGAGLVAWHTALAKAKASREFVKAASKARTASEEPVLLIGGSGRIIEGDEIKNTPETVLVNPNVIGNKDTKTGKIIDYRNYVELDVPALRSYKYIGRDSAGAPILMQGKVMVHKSAVGRMKSLFDKSWFQKFTIPEDVPFIGGTRPLYGALKFQSFIKGTLLSGGIVPAPFHQIHVGEHAIFHGVNPLNVPQINFFGKAETELMTHGLNVYNKSAMSAYEEGVSSGGLGEWLGNKVKEYGEKRLPEGHAFRTITDRADYMKRYKDFQFEDYIPRLKMAMAKAALGRAEKWYAKDIASGKMTRDQLLDNVAKQANAAFGELNYRYMGRNATYQDFLRLTILAPDFLEARMKFAGQALRPYGREQQLAFLKGAIITALTMQSLNLLFGDKHEINWEKPFTTTIGGRDYTPRSVIGDVWHLATDPRNFAKWRLSPVYSKTIYEVVTGRNYQDIKVDPNEIAWDVIKSWTPITLQGLVRQTEDDKAFDRMLNGVLSSLSVQSYRTLTEDEKLIYDIRKGRQRLGGYTKEEKAKFATERERRRMFKEGKLDTSELTGKELRKLESEEDDVAKFKRLTAAFTPYEMLRVWKAMPKERRELLQEVVEKKIRKAGTITRDEKAKILQEIETGTKPPVMEIEKTPILEKYMQSSSVEKRKILRGMSAQERKSFLEGVSA
jgi:hypothetical protein